MHILGLPRKVVFAEEGEIESARGREREREGGREREREREREPEIYYLRPSHQDFCWLSVCIWGRRQ